MYCKTGCWSEGNGGKKIGAKEDLEHYPGWSRYDFIIQEYVDHPVELAVMYHRFPGQKGKVTSVCLKAFLSVVGNGASSIKELMKADVRSDLQIKRLEAVKPALLNRIPQSGEIVQLEPIGNHCLGTEFINANDWIDDSLNEVFDAIGQQMKGIYFGRFDIRCKSLDDLRQGRYLSILEFNGASAEAAHVYDRRIPVSRKYRDIKEHWQIAFEIARVQKKKGVPSMNTRTFFRLLKKFRRDMNVLRKALNPV